MWEIFTLNLAKGAVSAHAGAKLGGGVCFNFENRVRIWHSELHLILMERTC
jgi:hypothetical protein